MGYIQIEGETRLHILLVVAYILPLYVLTEYVVYRCLNKTMKANFKLIQFCFILVSIKISAQYFEANSSSNYYGEYKGNLGLLSLLNFILAVNYECSQVLHWSSHSLKLIIFSAAVGIRYNTDLKIVV